MTKTLTEQYYDGTLPSGFYYFNNGKETYIVVYYQIEPFLCSNGVTVLDKVPSYDEYQKLQKKLEIAIEALKKYQEAINRFKKDPMNNIIMLAHQLIYDIDTDSKQALKEMKGVK